MYDIRYIVYMICNKRSTYKNTLISWNEMKFKIDDTFLLMLLNKCKMFLFSTKVPDADVWSFWERDIEKLTKNNIYFIYERRRWNRNYKSILKYKRTRFYFIIWWLPLTYIWRWLQFPAASSYNNKLTFVSSIFNSSFIYVFTYFYFNFS